MQMFLFLAQETANHKEPDVWQMLTREQRREAIAVLARLLVKTAATDAAKHPNPNEGNND